MSAEGGGEKEGNVRVRQTLSQSDKKRRSGRRRKKRGGERQVEKPPASPLLFSPQCEITSIHADTLHFSAPIHVFKADPGII